MLGVKYRQFCATSVHEGDVILVVPDRQKDLLYAVSFTSVPFGPTGRFIDCVQVEDLNIRQIVRMGHTGCIFRWPDLKVEAITYGAFQ